MSGGHWNYKDQNIDSSLNIEDLPKIINALKDCFHEVDWAESSDTCRETAEPRIYDILLKLGNELWADQL